MDRKEFAEKVIEAVVQAVAEYLNHCTDPDRPLADQPELLDELIRTAEEIPGSQTCEWGAYYYTPTVQLLDLNNDGADELVLHTQPFFCKWDGLGGISIVYHLDQARWRGTVIWPCTEDYGCPFHDFSARPEPLIQQLALRDSQGRAFMLVAGLYEGGDSQTSFLSVWRWENNGPHHVLDILLNNWCGIPIEWEVKKEGYILIPAAEETYRCPAEPARVYRLQGDEFVVEER